MTRPLKINAHGRQQMVDLYAQGETIRGLAATFKIGYGTAHRYLIDAGVPLRKRGSWPTTKKSEAS